MDFLKQRVHLPGPLYRAIPALYLIAGTVLIVSLNHLLAKLAGICLFLLAGNVMLKRLAAR